MDELDVDKKIKGSRHTYSLSPILCKPGSRGQDIYQAGGQHHLGPAITVARAVSSNEYRSITEVFDRPDGGVGPVDAWVPCDSLTGDVAKICWRSAVEAEDVVRMSGRCIAVLARIKHDSLATYTS